jgi:cytochrome P450
MTTEQALGTYPFPGRCPFQLPEEFAWLRRHAPVSQVTLAHGAPAWLVTSHDAIRTVLSDERFSRTPVRERPYRTGDNAGPAPEQGGGFDFGMSVADPEAHTRWRAIVGRVLTVRHAESMRAAVGDIVDARLDALATQPRPVDLMTTLAGTVPLDVLCELFAVPADLRSVFTDWAAGLRGAGSSMAAFGVAMRSLYEGAVRLVARERAEPTRGVLTTLMSTPAADGSLLTDHELVSTVLLLTIAGYETVCTQLGNGLVALFQHPAELAELIGGEVPSDAAVEEILRYAQAGTGFSGTTYTTEDVELCGVTIPAGSAVFISVDSAGRDESHVTDPDTFDLSRGTPASHLAFGFGHHFCLGAPLARVELRETLARLCRRFPTVQLTCRPDDVPFTSNRFSRYPRELLVTY